MSQGETKKTYEKPAGGRKSGRKVPGGFLTYNKKTDICCPSFPRHVALKNRKLHQESYSHEEMRMRTNSHSKEGDYKARKSFGSLTTLRRNIHSCSYKLLLVGYCDIQPNTVLTDSTYSV